MMHLFQPLAAEACAALLVVGCAPPGAGSDPENGADGTHAMGAVGSATSEELPVPTSDPVAPDPVDERVGAIETALAQGDFAAARSLADDVLADHPGHGYGRLLSGIALNKLLLYERARPEFEAVIRGGPTFEKYDAAWYYLGWSLHNTGQLALARGAFEEHLSRQPDEGDSHFALGLIEAEEGNDDAAVGRFRRSIELNLEALAAGNEGRTPDVAKAHARIADILLGRDETEAAVRELEKCVTLWPPHYNAWFKLYRAHTLLGNEDLAEASLRQHDHWKAQAEGGSKAP